MERKYLKLNDIGAYKNSFSLSNYIWEIVLGWDSFAKFTIGKQFANSIDSISANIAEGWGRYHKKDKIKFYYNARGSLCESLDWLEKGHRRGLLPEKQYEHIFGILEKLPKEINTLISYTNKKLTI